MATLCPRADAAPVESFWQRPFVQDILPLLASLFVHLSFIALGLITYKVVEQVVLISRTPVVIPGATHIMSDLTANPLEQLGFVDGTDTDRGQNIDPTAPEDSPGLGATREMSATVLIPSITGSGGGGAGGDDLIAVGPQTGGFGRGKGDGPGLGEMNGTGTGDPIGLAPFRDRNMRPPGTTFMRVRGAAMRVVFLCDATGSMMNKFDTLRIELRKAIDQLRPIQSFDIIFFSDDGYRALDKQLLLAVPENKRRAYEFLDTASPSGSSNPIPGLRAAFATGPQLVYLLTDGDFPNNAEVGEEIRRLDPANASTGNRPVIVNTIAFMDRGEEYEKLLRQIARETNGLFRFVSEEDLRR